MARMAERIHTDAGEIARLEATIRELSEGEHVRLALEGGDTLEGTVAMRPSAQVFETVDGRQGINAVVRIEAPTPGGGTTPRWHDVWVDRIRAVEHLASG
jgi:hypothetical protein